MKKIKIKLMVSRFTLREKCPYSKLFWSRIFPHSDKIPKDTTYLERYPSLDYKDVYSNLTKSEGDAVYSSKNSNTIIIKHANKGSATEKT